MTPPQASVPQCICGDPECDIPYGYCHCRCGQKTSIAKRTYSKAKIFREKPYRFADGHGTRKPRRYTDLPDATQSWREIPLTQGQVALISSHRYEEYMKWAWAATWKKGTRSFYAVRHALCGDGKVHLIYMHRQILGLDFGDKRKGDHVNTGETLDNRDSNLRISTQRQQQYNRRKHSNNTSGFKGVSLYKPNGKWRARVQLEGRTIYLGYFKTTEEAYAAWCKAASEHYGEFFRPE